MRRQFFPCLYLIVIMIGVFGGARVAMADLMITPTRVFFDDRERFAVVTLVNSGSRTQTYQMGWRFFEMQPEGDAYRPVDRSTTEFDLSKHIMFTPQRVTLTPGAKQKIRLRLSRPENVPDGEYRAHFELASVPDAPEAQESASGQKGATVSINVGYTIPFVFRVGQSTAKIDIGQISLSRNPVNGRLLADVPLLRSGGPYGEMGHLYLMHITPDGREEVVGEIGNAHIFPEVDRRVIQVPLSRDISGGKLKVVLYNFEVNNRYIIAQQEFPLN